MKCLEDLKVVVLHHSKAFLLNGVALFRRTSKQNFSRTYWNAQYNGCNNFIPATRIDLHLHGLTLIPAWISNYIYYKVVDEITYPKAYAAVGRRIL